MRLSSSHYYKAMVSASLSMSSVDWEVFNERPNWFIAERRARSSLSVLDISNMAHIWRFIAALTNGYLNNNLKLMAQTRPLEPYVEELAQQSFQSKTPARFGIKTFMEPKRPVI
jgi:hypothetical protein